MPRWVLWIAVALIAFGAGLLLLGCGKPAYAQLTGAYEASRPHAPTKLLKEYGCTKEYVWALEDSLNVLAREVALVPQMGDDACLILARIGEPQDRRQLTNESGPQRVWRYDAPIAASDILWGKTPNKEARDTGAREIIFALRDDRWITIEIRW